MNHRIAGLALACALAFTIPVQAGGPLFEDVTESVGIGDHGTLVWFATGQAWADCDGDGYKDLYLTDSDGPNALYMGNSGGTFTLSPFNSQVELPEIGSGGAVFADFDNDGDQDLFVANTGVDTLFRNDGALGFTDVSDLAGFETLGEGESATWGDYDEDGFIDLYVVNWWWNGVEASPLKQDHLYHNNGDGTFSDVTATVLDIDAVSKPGYAATFVDYDNDGDQDLYVVNDKLAGNVLWRNDGAGCGGWCFTDVSVATGADRPVWGMGIASGDYDKDGDLDFYFSSIGEMVMLQNQTSQGNPVFLDVSIPANVDFDAIGWGVVFFDFDNDSWIDLYLATDELEPDKTNRLFRNLGNGLFTDLSSGSGASVPERSFGVAEGDYDGDGFVDLVVGNASDYKLYRNLGAMGSDNDWIALKLEGRDGINRDALGTRVEIELSDGSTLMQDVRSDSSLGSGNDLELHFGLGTMAIDEIRITWLNGLEATLPPLDANRTWHVTYPDVVSLFSDGFESGDTSGWSVTVQ